MTGMGEERKYWFKAKRWGWGWGRPQTWQGWVVLVAYLVVVLGLTAFLDERSREQMNLYLGTVLVATVGLMLICVRTGEPPRWRWGNRRR